jgi:peptidoglycan-associated lipoprotein
MSGVSGSAAGFLPAIFFDFDDATLKNDALSALSLVVAAMKGNPNYRLNIIGYTDKVGSAEYNKILGERRANAVGQFLKLQGISADRIEIISMGSADPLTDVNSRDANRLNRRVQFELIKDGKSSKQFEEVNPETK